MSNQVFSVILSIALYQLIHCNCFNNGFYGLTPEWQNIRKKIYLYMIQSSVQLDKVIKIVEMTEGKKQISSNSRIYIHGRLVPVAALSEICDRPPSEIAGSIPTGGHGYLSVVSVVCCQVEVSVTS